MKSIWGSPWHGWVTASGSSLIRTTGRRHSVANVPVERGSPRRKRCPSDKVVCAPTERRCPSGRACSRRYHSWCNGSLCPNGTAYPDGHTSIFWTCNIFQKRDNFQYKINWIKKTDKCFTIWLKCKMILIKIQNISKLKNNERIGWNWRCIYSDNESMSRHLQLTRQLHCVLAFLTSSDSSGVTGVTGVVGGTETKVVGVLGVEDDEEDDEGEGSGRRRSSLGMVKMFCWRSGQCGMWSATGNGIRSNGANRLLKLLKW